MAAVASETRRDGAPAWLVGLQDLEREHGPEALSVRGAIPEGLCGTLYRNGPGRFSAGRDRVHHWFDADGAVSSVSFAGGQAQGAVRLVRTLGLLREERAGKRLFGGYGTPLARPLRELFFGDTKNPANTSVLYWQKRLFATCEADKPYEVDPESLLTVGETSLGGVVVGPFSAHPHYVASRRTTYNFGTAHGRATQLDAYALPDEGPPARLASFVLDGMRVVHDFAVTDRHLIFAVSPLYLSLFRCVVLRKPPVSSAAWRPERGTEMIVVPIDAPEKAVRFGADAFLLEHVVNAYEDADKLVVDCAYYDHADGLEGYVGGIVRGDIRAPLKSSLQRLRVDLVRRSLARETVLARPVELPRVSPRVESVRHRYSYSVEAGRAEPFTAIVKHDAETGAVAEYRPGGARYVGEGVFVPRPGAAAEDDGWVLTMVTDCAARTTALEILDARGLDGGPVASCSFGQVLPFGFHGVFVPSA